MKRKNSESWHWHEVEYDKVLEEMESSQFGLTSYEAKNRLQEFGSNQIKRKRKDGPFKLAWRQINNPLIWVLIGSSTLATLIGKITDGLVVLAVVIINTVIGFIQEFKALAKAQTIAVTFVIMFQIFYMINCRSLKDSVFRIGVFGNYTTIIGIGAILILQTLLIYTPFMQSVFSTTSLNFRDILISVASGFVIFPLIGIEKYFISLHARRKLIYSKCA